MPHITIKAPDLPEVVEPLAEKAVVIGRLGGDNDLPIHDERLSRMHCKIEPMEEGWCVVDLNSANGTYANGIQIERPYWLLSGDVIEVGDTRILFIAGTEADKEDDSIEASQTVCETDLDTPIPPIETGIEPREHRYVLQYLKEGKRKLLRLCGQKVTIGRHASCHLVFEDSSLSLQHARVEKRGESYYIVDAGSTNGVHVNGKKVEEAPLRPGTRIRLGRAVLGFKELLPRPDVPGGE